MVANRATWDWAAIFNIITSFLALDTATPNAAPWGCDRNGEAASLDPKRR
jgi:hypothetical protein